MQKLLRYDLKSLDQNDKTAIDTYLTASAGATSYSILSFVPAIICVICYIFEQVSASASGSFAFGMGARIMLITAVAIQWLAWERRREASLAARSLAERGLDVTGLVDSIFYAKYFAKEYSFLIAALSLYLFLIAALTLLILALAAVLSGA